MTRDKTLLAELATHLDAFGTPNVKFMTYTHTATSTCVVHHDTATSTCVAHH